MKGIDILDQVRYLIKDPRHASYDEINEAQDEICQAADYSFLRREEITLNALTSGTEDYNLNLVKVRQISYISIRETATQKWYLLEEKQPKDFDLERNENIGGEGGRPKYFRVINLGTAFHSIRVTPVPDTTYDIKVDYLAIPTKIDDLVIPSVPQAHLNRLIRMAAGKILQKKQDQADQQKGMMYITEARQGITPMIADSNPNRLADIRRPAREWLR